MTHHLKAQAALDAALAAIGNARRELLAAAAECGCKPATVPDGIRQCLAGGPLRASQIQSALERLGLELTAPETESWLRSMEQAGTITINPANSWVRLTDTKL